MKLFVVVRYRCEVVEMNFSSIIFDMLLKILFFRVSRVIFKEDALLMMYYNKTLITFMKIQNVAKEFINPYQM